MDLKIVRQAFLLLLLITLPMITFAESDKELSDMVQKIFQSKPIPCADNDRCYCLSYTTTIPLPLRYAKSQFCASKIEAGHVAEAEFKSWDEAGNKVDEGHFLNGKMNGKWISWHSNGPRAAEGNYKDGKQIGPFTAWHDNGQIEVQGQHKDDKANGEWSYWDKTGKLIKKLTWDNGKLISTQEIK
jgi:hypothetical protein